MATQILELDLHAAPHDISLRDDVSGILLLVTNNGRLVQLQRMPRTSSRVLHSTAMLAAAPEADALAPVQAADPPPPTSVVIPTHERPDDLARCLDGLASVDRRRHEVIVVDNHPLTSRTAAVAARFDVRYVVEPRRGLNRARNTGAAAAVHDLVAFIDDDVVVTPTWLAGITAGFENVSVGCATGLVLPLELETPAQEQFEAYCAHRRDLGHHVYSRATLAPSAAGAVGMGANMAFRRDLLREMRGFDPRLDAGTATRSGGDNDMFARILDAGWLIVYTPDARVWHRHRRSLGELRSCVFGYGIGVHGMLTKRLMEQQDLGAVVTAARWLIGPLVKTMLAKINRRAAPNWSLVLTETAGAPLGPVCFLYETWRRHRSGGDDP
jgi:GT2 family glycosyltransferase